MSTIDLDKTLNHQKYKDSKRSLMSFVESAKVGDIAILEGPSHVGKKHLVRNVFEDLIESQKDLLVRDSVIMPIIMTSVDYVPKTQDMVLRLFDNIINELTPIPELAQRNLLSDVNFMINDRRSESQKQAIIDRRLISRSTNLLIINNYEKIKAWDNMNKKGHAHSLAILHSICEASGCRLILTSTYDGMDRDRIPSDILAKITELDFPAYSPANSKDEYANWSDIIHSLSEALPMAYKFKSQEIDMYILSKTLGCYGLAVEWYKRAVSAKINGSSEVSFEECFKKTALTAKQLRPLSGDLIRKGDNDEEKIKASEFYIRNELGLKTESTKKRKYKRKPGVRNPSSDPLVVEERYEE